MISEFNQKIPKNDRENQVNSTMNTHPGRSPGRGVFGMTGWPSRPRGRRLSQNRNEGQRGREERGVLGYQAVWAPQWEHTATSWEGARARQGPRRRGARRATHGAATSADTSQRAGRAARTRGDEDTPTCGPSERRALADQPEPDEVAAAASDRMSPSRAPLSGSGLGGACRISCGVARRRTQTGSGVCG